MSEIIPRLIQAGQEFDLLRQASTTLTPPEELASNIMNLRQLLVEAESNQWHSLAADIFSEIMSVFKLLDRQHDNPTPPAAFYLHQIMISREMAQTGLKLFAKDWTQPKGQPRRIWGNTSELGVEIAYLNGQPIHLTIVQGKRSFGKGGWIMIELAITPDGTSIDIVHLDGTLLDHHPQSKQILRLLLRPFGMIANRVFWILES